MNFYGVETEKPPGQTKQTRVPYTVITILWEVWFRLEEQVQLFKCI